MKKIEYVVKNRKIQYMIIIWILLLKAIDIVSNQISTITYLKYFSILGFQHITSLFSHLWDVTVLLIIVLLIYRLLTDIFNISFGLRKISNLRLLGLFNVVICVVSTLFVTLQIVTLSATPLANPWIETSIQMGKRDVEIFGWYCIDWGVDYYDADFKRVRDMHIDGVFLRSHDYVFESDPEAFEQAVFNAQEQGLKVGILVFHPYDERYQKAWELPVHQDLFSDFSTNRSWIEGTYANKLQHLVANGDSLGVTHYMYDDMNFDRVSNVTNAQRFVDVTYNITRGQVIMMASYPPKENLSSYLDLTIKNWDWYTPPENIEDIKRSLLARPHNCTSLGQVVGLHQRTGIGLDTLETAYDALSDFNRIEIFTLRYGKPDWIKGPYNSILEYPDLIEKLTKLNEQIRKKENIAQNIQDICNIQNVELDLSKIVYDNPFSAYRDGITNEYGTKYLGLSYFKIKESIETGQEIEMRFNGNGTDGINGWFSYKVDLNEPIQVDVNTSLLFLLNLTPSNDASAWLRINIQFMSKNEEGPYNLRWVFKESKGDYVFKSDNGTTNNYLLGNIDDWTFYQFNVYDVYTTSFSHAPSIITGIYYSLGAEADNNVVAKIRLAKVSSKPFEINGFKVYDKYHTIKFNEKNILEIKGLNMTKYVLRFNHFPDQKKVFFEWSIFDLWRFEQFEWNLTSNQAFNILKSNLNTYVSNNSTEIYVNEKQFVYESSQDVFSIDLDENLTQMRLLIIVKTQGYFILILILSLISLIALVFISTLSIKGVQIRSRIREILSKKHNVLTCRMRWWVSKWERKKFLF